MKLPIAYVDIRFSAHATEDPEKVKKAVFNLFPEERTQDTTLRKNALKGYYNNPITLFETRLKDAGIIQALMEKLSNGLSTLDKETISRELNLLIEKDNLYLRFDKQAAFEGEYKLRRDDPIHIRIHFSKKDKRSIVEICREIGLIP